MKRIIIVIISLIAGLTIIFSILAFPLFSNISVNQEKPLKNNNMSTALIIANVTSGNPPLSVCFKPVLYNFDDNVQYLWDFDDGHQSKELNPSHTFWDVGKYYCKLIVKDDKNEFIDQIVISVIENNPPIIKIVVDKTSGNRPLTVHFDVDGFDTDGEIKSYEWEIQYPPFFSYQKVTTNNEKNFTERFLRPGFYEVKLKVTDDADKISTDYIKIQVLSHKIELLVQTGLYYFGIFEPIYRYLKGFLDSLNKTPLEQCTENIISIFGGN